jgi:NAD(P)-dependent dehydrogenase (short-subunit alcohol dehydrogenase family)
MSSVIVITGCSTGIGNATAYHLAKQGHTVFATMRNPSCDGGKELTAKAAAESLSLEVLAHDINDEQSNTECFEHVRATAGRIDVLVNNAGIAGSMTPVEEMPEAGFRAVMETNYFAAVNLMKMVLPEMRARGSGTIVNVTSVAGRLATMCQGAYTASKFALEGVSESLAQEMQPFGVKVKLVEPGVIVTPILTKDDKAGNENGERVAFNKQSPYVSQTKFMTKWFVAGALLNQQPQLVAEVIEAAIFDDSAEFRMLAGEDAEKLIAGRAAMSDTEWIEEGARVAPHRAATVAWWQSRFDMDMSLAFGSGKGARL